MPDPSFKEIGTHPDHPAGHVFFIHGFSGHSLNTWIAKHAVEGWPQWLSREFPRLAIWSIKYQTSVGGGWGGNMSLRERAIQLFEEMDGINLLNGQPKLFICHSLGGLVIKQILKTASEEYEPQGRGDEFIGSVKGIIFLGTPHKGSRWANLLQGFIGFFTKSKALKDLKANNEVLKSLYQWFRIHNQKWVVKSFYETKRLWGVAMIVSVESADPGFLHNVTDLIPLDADHLSICKPRSNLEQHYVTSRNIIKDLFAQEANNIIVPPPPKEAGGPFWKIAVALLILGLAGLSVLVRNKHVYNGDFTKAADIGQNRDVRAYSKNDEVVDLHPVQNVSRQTPRPHLIDQENIPVVEFVQEIAAPVCVMKLDISEIVVGNELRIDACDSQNYEHGEVVVRDRSGGISGVLVFTPGQCALKYIFNSPGVYSLSCRVEGKQGSAEAGEVVVEVLEPAPIVPTMPRHAVHRSLKGDLFVDFGFMGMRKSSGFIPVRVGFGFGVSESIRFSTRAGIHFNLDGGGSGHPISLDAMMTYHAEHFWISAGLGAWLVKDDTKLDFISGLGCDLFKLGTVSGSVFLENRLAFRDFSRIKDKARVSLGLRFSFN
jgi:hypothetical protein